jgi:hypothetical protein
LHGLKGNRLDANSVQSVSQSIAAAYDRENWYGHVVHEKCTIKYMLRDMAYMTAEDDFVKPVIRMDHHLMLRHRNLLESWVDRAAPIYCPTTPEAEYQENVRSLDDYLSLIEADFDRAIKFGAVAIKLGIAYERTLQFDKVSVSEQGISSPGREDNVG